MRATRRGHRRALLGCAGLVSALAAPVGAAAAVLDPLDAAAAWRDSLDGYRLADVPAPGATEAAIVILEGPTASAAPPARRAALARSITRRQDRTAEILERLGARVTFRYRLLVNGLAINVPTGRLPAVAALAGVTAVVPVRLLAPSGRATPTSPAPPGDIDAAAPRPGPAARPPHIALIDGGVDADHPWLGGGMGPAFALLGGADFVEGDVDPRSVDPLDAHGTAMAGIVMRSSALADLEPDDRPRLLAYRVVAPELVEGGVRAVARSDRVLAALERAVDPNDDGDVADRAEVVLLGVTRGFSGGGTDPLDTAIRAADSVGSLVVVPAGNDGPTGGPVGSVGGPAASPGALTVGALASPEGPRTARLEIELGPVSAALAPLPLMGGALPARGVSAPVVVLTGADGIAGGNDPAEFSGPDGVSRVQGAIAVVGRGGSPLWRKAELADAAGATALVVWDLDGSGAFPGYGGGAPWPIPVVGIGSRQGVALAEEARARPGLSARLVDTGRSPGAGGVASFSSQGPTADGRVKPEIVAPGVDQVTAAPGVDTSGVPRTTLFTGTSAAAAHVAARALRVRIDAPGLDPDQVRSLIVQGARPVLGQGWAQAGAGAVPDSVASRVAVAPAVISYRRGPEPRLVAVGLRTTGGSVGPVNVDLELGNATRRVASALALPAGARRAVRIEVPGGVAPLRGRLVLTSVQSGALLGSAPLVATQEADAGRSPLGRPQVRVVSGRAEVSVRIGERRRVGGALVVETLHDMALWLVPEGGGAPLRVTPPRLRGDWPTGTVRILVARRLASGLTVPRGRYVVRITARTRDGRLVRRESSPVALG